MLILKPGRRQGRSSIAGPEEESTMPKDQAGFYVRSVTAGDEQRWRAMFAALVATGPEPCAEDAPDFVWENVKIPNHPMQLLMAVDHSDDPIGFLLYVTHPYSWSSRPLGYLLDLYVEPANRGHGVGRALIKRLSEIGKEAGWLRIYWMTQADNDKAHALYGKVAQRSPLVRYDLILNDP
jgi:GNAT superfamily N-acetyltransferase